LAKIKNFKDEKETIAIAKTPGVTSKFCLNTNSFI